MAILLTNNSCRTNINKVKKKNRAHFDTKAISLKSLYIKKKIKTPKVAPGPSSA